MMSVSDDSTETVVHNVPTEVTDVVPKGIEFISDYDANFFPASCDPLDQQYDKIDTIKNTKAGPVKMLTTNDLKTFSQTLPAKVQRALTEDLTGKINSDVSFHGELVLRHVIPYLVKNSDLYAPADWEQLNKATPLVRHFSSLQHKYENVATEKVRGYDMYKNFENEEEFHEERIRLSSAALFQLDFRVDSLVRYIGGPHIAAHRDINKIRDRLRLGVEPDVLDKLIHGYVYGAPKRLHATSSDKNFMAYYRYGNHKTCDLHSAEYKKVMVKDSKRGNVILVDPKLLSFIPDLHLTPQGIVDVDNKWLSTRTVCKRFI